MALNMDCASCEPDWTVLGGSVGREEALADAEVPKAGGDKWRQGFVNSEAC